MSRACLDSFFLNVRKQQCCKERHDERFPPPPPPPPPYLRRHSRSPSRPPSRSFSPPSHSAAGQYLPSPTETGLPFCPLFPCLSRACLGKHSVCTKNRAKKAVFRAHPNRNAHIVADARCGGGVGCARPRCGDVAVRPEHRR